MNAPRGPRMLLLGAALALTLGLVPPSLAGQETGSVRGRVIAANSMRPLSGAQVSMPGTGRGSLTNAQGEYLILNVPSGAQTVRVQMIGYASATETVTVGAGQIAVADFSLAEEALRLDEVVVTGTAGAARRREIGNSIAQLNVADLPEPALSTGDLLAGRAAGVSILKTSGQVGGDHAIRLRGNVSALMSNNPLIYIDGVRVRAEPYPKNNFPIGYIGTSDNTLYSPLNDINPSEIERIEIIKGPAATTLYGTEAAAGVIQIFTKRGRGGQARWTMEVDQSVSRVPEFGPTRGVDGRPLSVPANEVSQYGTPQYMYLDPWLRTGWRQKYLLSVSGGIEEVQYYLSGAFSDESGVLPNEEMDQYNIRGNISSTPLPGLQLQWNTGYSRSDVTKLGAGGSAAGLTLNAFRRDRNYYGTEDPAVISEVLDFDLRNYVDHLITGISATYAPTSTLTNRLVVGYDLAAQETRALMPFGFSQQVGGQIHDTRWQNRTLTFDYVGSLKFRVAGNLASTFSWGGQSVTTEETSNSAYSQNFPSPGEPTVSSGAISAGFEDRFRVVNAGFFLQNVFDVADRLFVTTGMRVDGNSAFGANLGLQVYPKVSASYVISDESFWIPALGSLKLRAAYGHAGRAPGAFDAVRTWQPLKWGDNTAFWPSNLGNDDLGPERTAELEIGFDASVLQDRLQLDFTYYNQRTTDALFNIRQSPSTGGWGSQLANVGEILNTGIELTANSEVVRGTTYRWDLGATLATNHSETVSLGGAAPFSMGNRGWVVEGQPVPVMRGLCVTNPQEIADPVIERECNIGPNRPTLTLTGFTTLVGPYGISLSGRGEYQGGAYAYSLMDGESITRGIRWPACFNSYPAIDAGNAGQLTARERAFCITRHANRDWAIYPLDFFRVRDLTLSAPVESLVPGLANARLSLSAQNFFTWKKAKDSFADPETSGGFTDANNVGGGARVHSIGGSIPVPAVFSASIRLSF
jgi:TonB-dependent starch-binding outer membrane protein SusC